MSSPIWNNSEFVFSGRTPVPTTKVVYFPSEATDADVVRAAVSVVRAETSLALVEKLPETEAILISSQPGFKLIKTSGAEPYIK